MLHPGRMSKPFVFTAGLLLAVVIGWIDYLTGFYLVFSLFYLFPISVITWFCGRTYGLISAVFSTLVLLTSDLIWFSPSIHSFVPFWNAFVGGSTFMIIVFGLSKINHDMKIIRGIAEKEKILARTDSLTGIANMRAFYEELNHEIEKTRRFNRPITIVCMDLDDFKNVNDQYGHLAGDELLKDIAEMMRRGIRAIDTVARLGGDEFAILLPETDPEKARSVMERLITVIKDELRQKDWRVTISTGIASFTALIPSADTVISKADQLMYAAKNGGKDRIEAKLFDDRKEEP